ncbi:MAG: MlaD family protein [Planctomycetota bacterium]|jgi:hypothetical protein
MGGWIRLLTGLITLAVLILGGWYVLNLWQTGNRDTGDISLILRFSDAHGVPVGGSVRHKGVRVGEVLNVDVSPDDSGVIMNLSIAAKFHHTLRRNSRFWIVRPHFGGITQGVSGLDTLIKDPYVEYDTPDLSSPVLTSGVVVFGLNVPPSVIDSSLFRKMASRQSSVNFKVRFPSAEGMREGALVLYRDIAVGKVRGVDLSLDGRSVEVDVLLHGRYRETAHTDSVFWVAKPGIEFGFYWPTLLNVRDMSKILTGAALAYATPTDSKGRPLRDGDVLEGATGPPPDSTRFEGPLVSIEPAEGGPWSESAASGLPLAGVSFAFTEEDFFSNRKAFFQGTGLLFAGAGGQTLILTARTLADGAYSSSDFLSEPEIIEEDLKVLLDDRSVQEARLLWTDPEDRDIAVLALEGEIPVLPEKKPRFSEAKGDEEYFLLLTFRENRPGMQLTQPIPASKILDPDQEVRRFDEDLNLVLREWYGALLLDSDGAILGLVGRLEPLSDEAAFIALKNLPTLENSE